MGNWQVVHYHCTHSDVYVNVSGELNFGVYPYV